MSQRPTASIVIPVLNGGDTISDTLRALQGQAGGLAGVEIIVVDNGSSDDTVTIVQQFPVSLLHEPLRGASAARNRGLYAASNDVVINVDADTVPSRQWLREILAPFADPEVILVGGQTLSFPPGNAVERYIDQCGLHRPRYNVENPVMPFVMGGNLAVRRAAALAVGGWDESFPRGEDVEFCTRLQRRYSTGIHYQPSAGLFHRHRGDVDSLRSQAWGYGHGTALLYARYPEDLQWDVWRVLRVGRILVARMAVQIWTGLAYRLGRIECERAEFARLHRIWGWCFWRGFMNARYGDGRLDP